MSDLKKLQKKTEDEQKASLSELIQKLEEVNPTMTMSPTPGSTWCRYIPINKTKALKLYEKEWRRDVAYERQRLFFLKGLAPATYQTFSLPVQHKYRFGYETEIIKHIENIEDYDDQLHDLLDKYQEGGFNLIDIQSANFGVRNNQLMCLDYL